MSKKSSIIDHLPVASIAAATAEALAKKAGAEDHDANVIGALAGAWAGIIKAVTRQ
jgi:hypothetical protein